ncbi:MAG TPA: hypothetical protein VGP95_11310 [Gemmatimonadaceae bacterium]|jgi:hypothetical protein|nr:hypothetical protein [Gemmatimonadaceae bacterium]
MNPMNDRPQLERPATAGQPAPKKRFRIEKLEERIAPKKGGNTKFCYTPHCGSRTE